MKKSKFKLLLLLTLAVGIIVGTLQYKHIEVSRLSDVESLNLVIENKTNELIEELDELDFSHIESKASNLKINSNDSSEYIIENNGVDLCEQEIQYMYDDLDSDAKESIIENLEAIPELELIYKIGTSQSFSIEEYIENNQFIKDALDDLEDIFDEDSKNSIDIERHNKPKRAAAVLIGGYTISQSLLSAIVGATSTAASSACIPFVGWAIAAVAIVTVAVIIACNWDTISCCFSALIDYLCSSFKKIKKLIRGIEDKTLTMAYENSLDNAYDETKKKYGTGGWDRNSLDKGLDNSLIVAGDSAKIKDVFKDFRDIRPIVFLGKWDVNKYSCSYYLNCSNTTNGICFYMEMSLWNNYVKLDKDMWILNAYFLETMIHMNCIFGICEAPNSYFYKGIRLDTSAYAKELEFIYNHSYRWYSNKPVVYADHYL